MQQYQQEEAGGMAGSELASPGSRLIAWIIDTLIYVSGGIVGLIVGWTLEYLEDLLGADLSGVLLIMAFIVMIMPFIAILIVQIVLLVKRGQTIGKIAMKVRIVDSVTGAHPGWARLILLRVIVQSILTGIPGVGFIYFIVDSLLIFREDRRTIHDMIAGTRVDKVAA